MRLASTNAVSDVINSLYNKLKTDTAKDINDLDKKLSTDISNLDTQLSKDINDLDTQLNKDIDDLDTQLNKDINDLENNTEVKINDLKEYVDKKISDITVSGNENSSALQSYVNQELAKKVNKSGDTITGNLTISNGKFIGNLQGNADTTTKLAAPRTIKIGDTSKTFDGSANITWTVNEIGAAPVTHTHNYAGSTSAGGSANSAIKLAAAKTINGTSFDGSANITTANWGTARNFAITDGTNTGLAVSVNGSSAVSLRLPTTIKATLSGNASSATKLQSARTITIGNTGKNFDGSSNITWSLGEIGAASASHTHNFNNVTHPKSGAWWNGGLLGVSGDGVVETGKFLDFHDTNNTTNDYSTRLQSQGDTQNIVYLPTSTGTLALTDHSHSHLNIKGTNTISNTSNDTTANWGAQGVSIHWYTTTGQITDQPAQWGYIFNLGNGTEVHQIWLTQASGDMFHRGGNASGWYGSWRKVLDSSNYTSYAATSNHTHDNRYYTETEVNNLLNNKANTHSHPYVSTSTVIVQSGKKLYVQSSDPGAIGAGNVWIQCG